MPAMTRKQFLAAGVAAASTQLAYGQAADRKLKLGIIGVGWWAGVDMDAAWKAGNAECVAISDVDTAHLDEFSANCEKKQGSKPKAYKDYREMLNHPGLDGVLLTTPPHWHALQFLEVCKKGLPCYLEKPVAYDIREAQAMVEAQKKAGNIVQVGFQRRQKTGYQAAKEFIKSGQAGRIVQVDANIHYRAGTPDRVVKDPPSTLDWETWIGPAVKLPYSEAYAHRTWRLEKEYGNGHLVDWGIHVIDAVRTILEEDLPKSVLASGGIYQYAGKITTPDTLVAHWEFAKAPVIWRHRIWGAGEYAPEVNNGATFYGEKATVFATDGTWSVIPRDPRSGTKQSFPVPESRDSSMAHVAEWMDCIRTGKQPSCSIADAAKSTATVQLAMLSYEAQSKLLFDTASMKITNSAAANQKLKRAYRGPYKHPFAG